MIDHDSTFSSMGSDVRLLIGPPLGPKVSSPPRAAWRAQRYVEDFAARLSRFRPDSELSRLNAAPADTVAAGPLVRVAVRAGVWAAERTGGLVDPTLLPELERLGYAASLAGAEPASLRDALAAAPPRRAARPNAARRWAEFAVDDSAGVVRRPSGTAFDSGGIGKGLAADAVAHRLAGYTRFVVDCGGDLAVGGPLARARPYEVEVEHPLGGESVARLRVASGGVATSGLNVRIWRRHDGLFAHHLVDPASGEPAWTGLIGATALAPTALEAETLSKAALLSGPERGRTILSEHGGVLIHDDGDVELVGLVRGRVAA